MKKVLSLLFAIMMITPLTARCEDDISVTLNGAELTFDVPPMIIDGRTLVPMRAIFEALGAKIYWNGETQTITAFSSVSYPHKTIDTTIIMQAENNIMTKAIWDMPYHSRAEYSGEIQIKLDVAPMIVDGRTLVPVRAVSESLDCEVEWDSENRVVIITSSETETEPTAEPSAIPIEYDDTAEQQAHYMRDFKIIDTRMTDSGDMEITYSLLTFLEGRGTVSVAFNCLDENGNVVDSWTGMFIGTDYTWSRHEDTVTVSGKTKKIEFILN